MEFYTHLSATGDRDNLEITTTVKGKEFSFTKKGIA